MRCLCRRVNEFQRRKLVRHVNQARKRWLAPGVNLQDICLPEEKRQRDKRLVNSHVSIESDLGLFVRTRDAVSDLKLIDPDGSRMMNIWIPLPHACTYSTV